MDEHFQYLLQEANEDFQKVWMVSGLQDRVYILQHFKQQCESNDEEVKKKIFQIVEPFYVEFIRHSNPKIFVEGLEMLQIQLNSQTKLGNKVASLVCAVSMSALVKKDQKDKAVQLLLGFFEHYNQDFVSGIKDTFQFKEPKSITELLRFFQLLIVKNDEQKLKFLTEQMDTIIDFASNFSTSAVRQTAVDLMLKLAQDLGTDFIKEKIPLLKESQRILIAKRLKEQGIADEEFQKMEILKQEGLKQYEKNKDSTKYRAILLEQIKQNYDEQKIYNILPKHLREQLMQDENIKKLKEIPLFVDKIKYARGKVKVHVFREIHDIFVKHPEELDDQQLIQRWNFEKYFTFDNPLIKKQLVDILTIYIKKMLETEDRKDQMVKILKSQVQGIIIQIIKTYNGSQCQTQYALLDLIKYLLELQIFNHEIMTSFYDGMLNKSDVTQNSSVKMFRMLIISQYIKTLPKIELILNQIASLTSSQSPHLRKNALDALVETASFIGIAIYQYTNGLNKFQASQFQQRTKHLFKSDDQNSNNNQNSDNIEEEIEEQKLEGEQISQIQTNENLLNELKLQLCMKNINNEDELIIKLNQQIQRQQDLPVDQRIDYVYVFQQLLQNYSEFVTKNSTLLIGKICERFQLQENQKLFEILFQQKSNEYTQFTLQKIFQKIGFQNLSKLILDLFFQRYLEEKVCTFLLNIVDKVDDETLLLIVKYLIQNISEVKDPQAKTTFINFLAKVQKAKDQEYVNNLIEQTINNEKFRVQLIKKIEQSYRKYDFLQKSMNQSDEIIAEKKKLKQLQQKQEEEEDIIKEQRNQKAQISFKEFRKQQLQKIQDESNHQEQPSHPMQMEVEKEEKLEKKQEDGDDEI